MAFGFIGGNHISIIYSQANSLNITGKWRCHLPLRWFMCVCEPKTRNTVYMGLCFTPLPNYRSLTRWQRLVSVGGLHLFGQLNVACQSHQLRHITAIFLGAISHRRLYLHTRSPLSQFDVFVTNIWFYFWRVVNNAGFTQDLLAQDTIIFTIDSGFKM